MKDGWKLRKHYSLVEKDTKHPGRGYRQSRPLLKQADDYTKHERRKVVLSRITEGIRVIGTALTLHVDRRCQTQAIKVVYGAMKLHFVRAIIFLIRQQSIRWSMTSSTLSMNRQVASSYRLPESQVLAETCSPFRGSCSRYKTWRDLSWMASLSSHTYLERKL